MMAMRKVHSFDQTLIRRSILCPRLRLNPWRRATTPAPRRQDAPEAGWGPGAAVLEALTRTPHIERDRPRVENPSVGRSRGCRKGPVKVAYEGFETCPEFLLCPAHSCSGSTR